MFNLSFSAPPAVPDSHQALGVLGVTQATKSTECGRPRESPGVGLQGMSSVPPTLHDVIVSSANNINSSVTSSSLSFADIRPIDSQKVARHDYISRELHLDKSVGQDLDWQGAQGSNLVDRQQGRTPLIYRSLHDSNFVPPATFSPSSILFPDSDNPSLFSSNLPLQTSSSFSNPLPQHSSVSVSPSLKPSVAPFSSVSLRTAQASSSSALSHDSPFSSSMAQGDFDVVRHNAEVLGLSSGYVQLARDYLNFGYKPSDFKSFIVKEWPRFIDDLNMDCQGGSSILLQSIALSKNASVSSAGGRGLSSVSSSSVCQPSSLPSRPATPFSSSVPAPQLPSVLPVVTTLVHTSFPSSSSSFSTSGFHGSLVQGSDGWSQSSVQGFPRVGTLGFPPHQSSSSLHPSVPLISSQVQSFPLVAPSSVTVASSWGYSNSQTVSPSLGSVCDSRFTSLANPQGGIMVSAAGSNWPAPGVAFSSRSSFPPPLSSGSSYFPPGVSEPSSYPPGVFLPPVSSGLHSLSSEDRDLDEDSEDPQDLTQHSQQNSNHLKPGDYRRMLEFITSLYPQALGVSDRQPRERSLFENIFAVPPSNVQPMPELVWFERLQSLIRESDNRLVAHVLSGKFDFHLIPGRKDIYSVHKNPSLGRGVPLNKSIELHLDRPPAPTCLLNVNLKEGFRMETALRSQTEALSHTMWVLSGLIGFLKRDGYSPSDQSLFDSMIYSLSAGLLDIGSSSLALTNFVGLKRRQYITSHLPPYFPDTLRRPLLAAPFSSAESLFREEDIENLLASAQARQTLKTQQAMIEASLKSAKTSPDRRSSFKRKQGRSPQRSPKRVKFVDNQAGSSSMYGSSSSSARSPSKRKGFRP